MPKRKPKDLQRSPDLPQNWIERHIERLQACAFYSPLPLDDWQYKRSRMVEAGVYETVDTDWSAIRLGETWGGPGITGFFNKTIALPDAYRNDNTYLDLDLDGGETQLAINGEMRQGLDRYRNLVYLGDLATDNNELLLELEAFTINYPYDAREKDERDFHLFKRAQLLVRDPVIEACVFDLKTVFDAYLYLWRTDQNLEIEGYLLAQLEAACRCLGPSFSSQEHAKQSAARASAVLQETVFASDFFKRQGEISIYAHSHLDIVYLWPLKETFRKNGRTVSNMLNLMREYPDYIYSQSQPYLYEKLSAHYPILFEQVKTHVQAGRWDVVGAMYVEPDGNLLGPESWVRQIMFGKRILRQQLGVDSRICWLPDVFGVMHTLPQILKRAGIDYFLTAKLNIWNDTNNFPYDSFRWRGPDGSEVITHFPATHFAQDLNYENLYRHWTDYREKQQAPENFFVYGWGDGGGGPTREMLEYSSRVKQFPGLPKVKTTLAEDFFKRLADSAGQLPVWDDELYMEGHRGTYTTKAELKRANRKGELLYRDIEMISAMAAEFGGPYIQQRLNEGWKQLLLNQFHDTLPGSHVPEAVSDIDNCYQKAFAIGNEIQAQILSYIADRQGNEVDVVIINTLNARKSLVAISAPEKVSSVRLSNGQHAVIQRSGDGCFIEVDLLPYGWITGKFEQMNIEHTDTSIQLNNENINTPYYDITLDENGNLAQIYDKEHARNVLTGPGNQFQVFEDDPGKSFGAWDIAYHFEEYSYPVEQTQPWKLTSNGPLFTSFKAKWQVLNSTIEQEMRVYTAQRQIEFHTQVDWQDPKKLLKVAFPLCIRSRNVTYDLPFGHIQRPTHRNTGWEQAKFEVCGHKWADMSEGDYGVAIINDCKYGYDAKDNLLRLTLLRSPVKPSPQSDIGIHRFSYAILPHSGNWQQAEVDKAGYAFNTAPISVLTPSNDIAYQESLPGSFSLIQHSGDTAMIETIKQSEDGDSLVLRVFDSHGTHNQVQFNLASGGRVEETDLLEENPIPFARGESFTVPFNPYEIRTFKITK